MSGAGLAEEPGTLQVIKSGAWRGFTVPRDSYFPLSDSKVVRLSTRLKSLEPLPLINLRVFTRGVKHQAAPEWSPPLQGLFQAILGSESLGHIRRGERIGARVNTR